MLTFGQTVQAILRDRGVPQYKFAESIGMNASLFSRKLRGDVPIRSAERLLISQQLGISPDDVDSPLRPAQPSGRVPLVEWATAGRLVATGGKFDQSVVEEWVSMPSFLVSKQVFAIRVSGDSMSPTFTSGDTLICEPILQGDENRLTEGRIVAVWLETDPSGYGSGGQVGRWQHLGGVKARLRKDNPKYEAIDLHLTAALSPRIAVVVEQRRRL